MTSIISYLKENAERYPERPAVSDAGRTLSWRDLWRKAQGMTQRLMACGFPKGANILVEARAGVSFAVAAMGIQLAGCVLVPMEKNAPRALRLRLAEEMHAPLLIGEKTTDGIAGITFDEISDLPTPSSGNDAVWKFPAEDDLAEILYTTGSTGKSKAVQLSHRAVWASSDNNRYMDNLNTDTVYLIASPLNHISALRKLYGCILGGAHAVLVDGFFDMDLFYEAIERYQVNALVLPPAALRFLLLISREKLHSLAGQLKLVHTNSAPMTETDKAMMRQCLPGARLIFGYGATEAGSVCCAYDYADFPGLANCVGKPSPHAQITVVDENRREIRSSKEHPGFLAVTGDAVMQGYWHDAELTAEVLEGNTIYTQDWGYRDENGFVFMLGRAGDIINCGGLKIAPAEVENAVMQYPGIRECVCFGVPDPVAGRVAELHIVPDCPDAFDLKEFRSFLQGHLEIHQIPRVIKCVRTIPKTSNGKIDRKRLVPEA